MTKAYLEPANTIITKVGADIIAAAADVHVSRVYRWRTEKSKGGTGGLIPIDHIRPIITVASTMGISLSADDFLPPAPKRPRSVRAGA
jgi:hypothetical protein